MKLRQDPALPADLPNLVRQLTLLWIENATQVNALSEGQLVATYNAVPAMPAAGTYAIGDFVSNSAPAILGAPGTRYVVQGWRRLTDGSSHVLNTDWAEFRTLTGT